MNTFEQNLHAYDRWADEALIESLASIPAEDATVSHLVAHLAASKEIWLARITGHPQPPTDRFPSLPLEDAIRRLRAADAALVTIVAGDLDRIMTYKDTLGHSWTNPLRELVIHLANHGTYHRGQLATAIKRAGGQPAVTDYIAWCRRPDAEPLALR